MVLSTIAWTYGDFAAFVVPALVGWLTHRVLKAPAAARLANPDPKGAIDKGTELTSPGCFVVFWTA